MLWSILRNRLTGGCKFRRQVPIGRYFADFACVERRIVVELDGGQHAVQVEYDVARTAALSAQGWLVMRFWNTELLANAEGVAMAIQAALDSAAP